MKAAGPRMRGGGFQICSYTDLRWGNGDFCDALCDVLRAGFAAVYAAVSTTARTTISFLPVPDLQFAV